MDKESDYSECPLCERNYRTAYLNKHMKKVHPPDYETVVCQFCEKLFKTKNHLHDHVREIHNKSSSAATKKICQYCGKLFANKRYMNTHIRRVHIKIKENKKKQQKKLMKFECDYCGKTFPYKELIQKHMIVHCDTKMVKCELCSKQYKSSYINEHKRRVHPVGVGLECDLCHNKYKTKRLLKAHMQVTHKRKHLNVTNRMYTRNSKLKEKVERNIAATVQPDENPGSVKRAVFECSHCNYAFQESFELSTHLQMVLKREIFEELGFEDAVGNVDDTSYCTKKVKDIDCIADDSEKNNNDNVGTKWGSSEEDMFKDADRFLFEIKQEIKLEEDLEIGPVILQLPDLFNS